MDRIGLSEVTRGGDTLEIGGGPVVAVDINSAILITPSFGGGLPTSGQAGAPLSAEETALREQRQDLLDLLRWVQSSINDSRTLAEEIGPLLREVEAAPDSASRARAMEPYAARVVRFEQIVARRQEVLTDYLTSKGLTVDAVGVAMDDLTPLNGNYGPLRDFTVAEISALNEGNRDRLEDLTSEDRRVSLLMGASLVRGANPSPVHLPGYDTYEAGLPRVVPKVSFELTPEEADRLSQELEFNQSLATRIRGIQEDKEELDRVLSESASELRAQVESVTSTAGALVASLDGALAAVESDARLLTDATLAGARARAAEAAEAAGRVGRALREIVQTAEGIGDFAAAPAARPDLLVVGILGSITSARTDLGEAVDELRSAIDGLGGSVRAYGEAIRALADRTAEETLTTLDRTFGELLTQLTGIGPSIEAKVGSLALLAEELSRVDLRAGSVAEGVERRLVDDPEVRRRDLRVAPATELSLLTVDRQEGDYLRLQANVLDGEEVIEEGIRTFQVSRFGWYSEVTTGLVFVSTEDDAYASLGRSVPTAQSAFLFRHRAREGSWTILNGVGLGFHSVALDFEDSSSIELGLGASVHIFDNVLQLGVGKNLHASEQPTYWFFGLGVLDLLNRARGGAG